MGTTLPRPPALHGPAGEASIINAVNAEADIETVFGGMLGKRLLAVLDACLISVSTSDSLGVEYSYSTLAGNLYLLFFISCRMS